MNVLKTKRVTTIIHRCFDLRFLFREKSSKKFDPAKHSAAIKTSFDALIQKTDSLAQDDQSNTLIQKTDSLAQGDHHAELCRNIFAKRRTQYQTGIVICFLVFGISFQGCFILRPFAGANIDIEQLQKAREAKVLEIRHDGAQRLSRRLANGDSISNADLSFYFSEALLNKAASQLDSTTGWLDSLTSYSIRNIRVKLYHGSAIATVSLAAFNHEYDVDVNLLMDCILAFKIDSGKFFATLEPFNVVPNVKASGMIASLEGIIQDIVTMKLSTLSDNFPPIQFPVDFNNQFPVQGNSVQVRTGMNMNISTSPQTLKYSLALKEVLIFKEKLFLAMNVKKVGVRK